MQDTRIAPYEQQKPRKIKPYEHKAHYYETDKMGIVHHSNHIRWMEEARMDLLEQLGYSFQQLEEAEVISPVVAMECKYTSMVHFHDTVVIETKISDYDGAKMTIQYRMTDKKSGELRALAKSEHCFLNAAGIPISLKRSYPELDTKFFEMVDDEEYNNPDIASDTAKLVELHNERTSLSEMLDELYEKWEELSEELIDK